MLVEIQVLPRTTGTATDSIALVDTAIAVIAASGLHHEVGAMGTTIEGDPDQVWPLLRAVHEACLEAGAASEITLVKLAQGADSTPGIDDLVARHR